MIREHADAVALAGFFLVMCAALAVQRWREKRR